MRYSTKLKNEEALASAPGPGEEETAEVRMSYIGRLREVWSVILCRGHLIGTVVADMIAGRETSLLYPCLTEWSNRNACISFVDGTSCNDSDNDTSPLKLTGCVEGF
jgi:hypothetical protein